MDYRKNCAQPELRDKKIVKILRQNTDLILILSRLLRESESQDFYNQIYLNAIY